MLTCPQISYANTTRLLKASAPLTHLSRAFSLNAGSAPADAVAAAVSQNRPTSLSSHLPDAIKAFLPQSLKHLPTQGPAEESFQASLNAIRTNPNATWLDAYKQYLDYAIVKTPRWTDDDRSGIRVFNSGALIDGPATQVPHVDTSLPPQQALYSAFGTLLPSSANRSLDEPLLWPVITNKPFPAKDVAALAAQNIWLVGIPQHDLDVHGLLMSPAGQMIHDAAHALSSKPIRQKALDALQQNDSAVRQGLVSH